MKKSGTLCEARFVTKKFKLFKNVQKFILFGEIGIRPGWQNQDPFGFAFLKHFRIEALSDWQK